MSLTSYKYMHIIASNKSDNGCSHDGTCRDCKCKCFLEQSYSPIEYIFLAITRNPKRHEKMCICGHSYADHFCHDEPDCEDDESDSENVD